MGTCDQCVYWDRTKNEHELPSSKHDHRRCLNDLINGLYNEDRGNTSIVSYDAIGTGPKFGCIHFSQG